MKPLTLFQPKSMIISPICLAVILLLALCPAPCALCQIPQGFNYQAIARDISGNPITDPIDVKIAILSDDDPETIIREELFSAVDPNDQGLFTLVIGTGAHQSGVTNFSDIDWTVTPKYIKTKIYYLGDWKDLGAAQLWSVPYAMVSGSSETWTTSGSNIYRSTGNVGIGTSSPGAYKLNVTGGPVLINNGDGLSGTLRFSGHTYIGSADWGDLRLISGTNSGLTSIRFITENAERVYITGNGYLGIGVWPSQMLQVNGNILSAGNITANGAIQGQAASGSGDVLFVGNDSKLTDVNIANTLGIYGTVDANQGHIKLGAAGPLISGYSGNLGVGITTPGALLHVGGNANITGIIRSNNTIGTSLEISNQTISNKYQLSIGGSGNTVPGGFAVYDSWQNQARLLISPDGKVGIGTISPAGQLSVQVPTDAWADEVPLFEVKNKKGIPVLAVYNYGVRVLVDQSDGKAVKGGFNVSGYDYTKAGTTIPLMIVNPDSIRFNISNSATKAPKGGFAVGSFADAKGAIDEDFMYITPVGSESGNYNTLMGYKTGTSLATAGNYNSFIGYQAGYSTNSGTSNVFIGYKAGYSNYGTTILNPLNGANNVYIGTESGLSNLGYNNVLIGNASGKALTGGYNNVYVGCSAGLTDLTGHYNTYIGSFAGQFENGSDNVMIGYGAGFGSDESDILVIGNRNNNALISGSFATDQIFLWGKVGINTGTPASYLEIVAPGNALRLTRSGTSNYFDLGIGTTGYLVVNNQTNSGAYCTGASWVNSSDRNLKENFTPVDQSQVLAKIDNLEISSWNYIGDPDEVKHIGPVAQDFYMVFGLGNDDRSISTIDPAGISLLAIKELNLKNKMQEQQIISMQKQIDDLKLLVEKLVEQASVQIP